MDTKSVLKTPFSIFCLISCSLSLQIWLLVSIS